MKTMLNSGFAALCLATLCAAPASAANEHVTVTINHSDLDLAKPDDVRKLRQRVRMELEKACGTEAVAISAYQSGGGCLREAMEEADQQIDQHRSTVLAAR